MKKAFVSVVSFSLLTFFLVSPAIGSVKAGAICAKLGSTSLVSGKKFTCIKSNKKLVWNKGFSISNPLAKTSPTISPSPPSLPETPTPSPEIPNQKISGLNYPRTHKHYLEMQKIVEMSKFDFISEYPNLTIVREQGVASNGQWEAKINKSIKDSLGFLNRFDMDFGTDPVEIALGRNSIWFKNYLTQRCQDPNAGGGSKFGSSSAYVCGTLRQRGIVTNPATVLSRMEIDTVSQIDLDTLNVSPSTQIDFLTQLPHEFFHVYQEEKWKKINRNFEYVPLWFREGSATVVGLVVATLAFSDSSKYADIKNLQLLNMRKDLDQICENSIRSMDLTVGSGCQYFQGAVAVEVLMANHGGWNVLKKLTEGLGESNFGDDFQRIVGIPLESFYDEVDRISKDFGYASKI